MQLHNNKYLLFILNELKSVGYCISTNGLFVFKKLNNFKKAVGLKVNHYGIIFPLCGLMMFPDCGEASPYGTMMSLHGIIAVPYRGEASPHGMMTVPYGMITSPCRLMIVPYGMITRPHGLMMIPYGTMMIPSDISGNLNVNFNLLPRLNTGLMKLFQQ